MSKNEKAVATNNGSILRTGNQLTMKNQFTGELICMKNIPHNKPEFQLKLSDIPTRETSLSRLPKLADRPKFELPTKAAVCVGCGGRLDRDDNFQQSTSVCRECLKHYAKIDTAIDEASKRKRRDLLEKFAGVK